MARVLVCVLSVFLFGLKCFVDGKNNAKYLYQLQGATFDAIHSSHYQYYVLDADDTQLTPVQVESLKKENKAILGYVSIGEAEDYRDYWKSDWKTGNPPFLGKLNEDFGEGSYKVKFWMSGWQTLLLQFIREHILIKGYSGVYLDNVDAYEYYEEEHPTAAQDMVQLISKIRNLTRTVLPNGCVFAENAVELYQHPGYKALLDGIAVVETWTEADDARDNDETEEILGILRQAQKDGKVVLSVDFPTSEKNVCAFYQKCEAEKFVCAVFDRGLTGTVKNCAA